MTDEWEALFGADIDEEENADVATEEAVANKGPSNGEADTIPSEEPADAEDDNSGEKKSKIGFLKSKNKKNAKDKGAKKDTQTKQKTVHGLKRKEQKEDDPYTKSKAGNGRIVMAGIGAVALIAVIGAGALVANKKIAAVNQTNDNLTQQIASRTKNVYTAKRDLKAGDEIVTTGESANVELSQVYTSLSDSAYISADEVGYALVDIEAGMPVMASEVGETNPVDDMNSAIEEATSIYRMAKEMPYKITADYVDLETGNSLVASRDLLLDDGANEKAFNTEAESIDGYVLKSIQVNGEGTHAYGVCEKSMKEGVVNMFYYTTKGGWGRHEIKGNIRVTFGYEKQDDPNAVATSEVLDDSAWMEDNAAADVVESTITEETLVTDAEAEALEAELAAENEAADAAATEEAVAQ